MLITLCYLYLWLRLQRCYTAAVRSAILLRRSRCCFTFCREPGLSSGGQPFLSRGDRGIFISEPQVCEDLSKWTLVGSSLVSSRRLESIAFIIEATSRQKLPASPHRANKSAVDWSDLCLPLALSPGQPYRAVAAASLEDFSRIGVAFLEDRLRMGNGLVPDRIVSVSLRETELRDLLEKRQQEEEESQEKMKRSQEERPQEADGAPQQHTHGHHLHLSSCHECLELESSTILSVRCASAESIPDLPEDGARAEEEEQEEERSGRWSARPPNLLVFAGGCEERFRRTRALLAQCVDAERYTIYHLRPHAALSEPWAQNALLLVLSGHEPLSPALAIAFLTYLSRGGRVLGLSSSLCPAGLALRPGACPRDRPATLRAHRTHTQLRVRPSGSVYERTGQADLELWGELGQEMAIVRVSHGPGGGEAVLCQVCLEADPDPGGSSPLKENNALRLQLLMEILMALGLSCDMTPVPPHSPVYLLHTHTEQKRVLLQWLRRRTQASGGVLQTGAGELKVLWAGEVCEECDGQPTLHTDPPASVCERFSLQTYRRHLRSRRLGRTVLFADVTSSTMGLLDGFVQAPQEVGLVAIAARQTGGKGRGGNAWLSPLGCAMFTLHLEVPLDSHLGQSIAFLQHLAALAVVEAVRTLPGYEDVDLRLKWPNDIYSGDLVKLGGVLVSSSLTGRTFSLLIGCGFNVSNSRPTVCINELVRQRSRETGLELEELSPETLIARTLSLLEELVEEAQSHGVQELLPRYYTRWLHSGARVRLGSEDGPEAEVLGLDTSGFLQVRADEGVVSLQPDGNSFDMMKNLVLTKRS